MSTALSRKTKGSPGRILSWSRRHLPQGEYRLVTDGLHEPMVVNVWPSSARDSGADWGEEVIACAQSDCDARGTTTQYQLQWIDDGEVRATYVIRCRPADEGPVEGASIDGIISQQMRHTEAMVRMMAQLVGQTAQQQQRLVETLAQRLEGLERERAEILKTQVEAVTALAEAEATMATVESSQKEDELRQKRLQKLALLVGKSIAKENPEAAPVLAEIASAVGE